MLTTGYYRLLQLLHFLPWNLKFVVTVVSVVGAYKRIYKIYNAKKNIKISVLFLTWYMFDLAEKFNRMAQRNYTGKLKLLRSVSFRLLDPEYLSLIAKKGAGNMSDLLRDIVSQHISKNNVRPELPFHVNLKTKK